MTLVDLSWPDAIWHEALTGIPPFERDYLLAALRLGEKTTKTPRIRLSTIHGAKGGEAENVVLYTDISPKTDEGYQRNPDDEHRVFYVGLTRAKERLYVMTPQTRRYFVL